MQRNRLRVPLLLLGCAASLLLADAAAAQWALYEETSIAGTISGSIRKGHVFKTRSGHIYEVVDHVYLYEYEYSPGVVVLSDGGLYKLIIEGFDEPLVCKCLNCSQEAAPSLPDSAQSEEAIIKATQVALNALGYEAGTADGSLNAQTRSSVRKFRVDTGLAQTDSLDATTLRSIAVALAKEYPDEKEALGVAVYLMQASQEWPPSQSRQESPPPPNVTPRVVESFIISDFNGFDYGNIYKLANGQIWEQTEVWTWVWLWVNPKVLIWDDSGIYRMKVEGIEHAVMVRRIK